MNTIVLANLISMAGCLLMVYIGLVKEKNRILGLQCVQFTFMATANLMLGAVSGCISGVVSIIRNIVCTRRQITVPLKLSFIAIQTALSWGALKGGLIEWLPLLSGALFTWFIDVKSEVVLKTVIIIAQSTWLVYDLYYMNYVTAVFDAMTIASNVLGIILILKDRKK